MDIIKLPLEDFEIPDANISSELGLKNEYTGAIDFGVIGCGQCGGRIAKSFYDIGYKKTIAINTATADLNPLDLPEEQKLKIGNEGSGKDMEKGKEAAETSSQKIFDKMKTVFGTVDKIIISVGFGGGSGAGSLCTLISIAQSYLEFIGSPNPRLDVMVVGAMPTIGELNSPIVKENNDIIKKVMFLHTINKQLGPLFLIDNSKIEKLYRGIPSTKFWSTINSTITGLFQTFNYLATQESDLTTFDREDYKALLDTPGLAMLGVTLADLEKIKLSDALQNNIKKTLLAEGNYQSASCAACIVAADKETLDTVNMEDINYGFDTVANMIGQANVYRGLYKVESKGVRAYTMICGMQSK